MLTENPVGLAQSLQYSFWHATWIAHEIGLASAFCPEIGLTTDEEAQSNHQVQSTRLF